MATTEEVGTAGPPTSMTTAVTPKKPIMGGIVQLTKDEWAAWTGGKPQASWSGLDSSAVDNYDSPNQLRPASSASSTKGYNLRKEGLADKFKRSDDLTIFQRKVLAHLQDTGMDTIAYLPNPIEPSKMIHIVTDYARYSISTAESAYATQAELYDKYDVQNNSTACKFLLASLDRDLHDNIVEQLEDDPGFAVVWLYLIKAIQSISIERFEDLKAQIKKRHPSQYPGQNLESLAADFRRDAKELVTAGHYDHNLSLNMLEAFLKAGGPTNEDYRFPLRSLKARLDSALLLIGHMSKADADKHMQKENLTFKDICRLASTEYRKQFDRKQWPPASHASDSKAPPNRFGANLATGNQVVTEAQVLALIQQAASSSNSSTKGACLNCGKHGHWRAQCPELKNGKAQPAGDVSNKSSGRKGRPPARRSQGSSWRTTPPAEGESATKTMHNKTFKWCGKCHRWSTTHDTASHVSKQGNSTDAAAHYMVPDPALWHVPFGWATLWTDIQDLVTPYLALVIVAWLVVGFTFLGLAFVGPFLWILLGALTVHLYFLNAHPYKPPDPPLDRHTRRKFGQYIRKQSRRRPSYRAPYQQTQGRRRRKPPREFESPTHWRRAPTLSEQHDRRVCDEFVDHVHRVHSRVNALQSGQQARRFPRAVFGREGEITVNKKFMSEKFMHRAGNFQGQGVRSKIKPRPCPRPVYRPKPATGKNFCADFAYLTHRRAHAAKKILCQVNMARMTTTELANNPACLRAALQKPPILQFMLAKEATFPIIWDSGASISISHCRDDFVGPILPPGPFTKIQGIARGLQVQGRGHVMWAMRDKTGQLRLIKVPALYIPNCRARLLSTTSLLQTYPDETIVANNQQATLSGNSSDPTRGSVVAYVNPTNNIPESVAYCYGKIGNVTDAMSGIISEVHRSNINLNAAEKELLRWHQRLGHLSFAKIKFLMRTGILASSQAQKGLHAAACKIVTPPKCAACQFGKQTCRPAPGQTVQAVRDRANILKADHLLPGQRTSVDHFICSTKGRLFSSKGKEKDDDKYTGGCVFIDHASGFVHVEFQTHLNTHETIKSKEGYELMCRDHGVIPQSYLTDNGSSFTSRDYVRHLQAFAQTIRHSGPGAHHHNGIAERSIRTIMQVARTMMLHAAIHWPEMADPTFWPMAVQHAVFLWNKMPTVETGLSPHDIFTRSRWPQSKFHDVHTWGCPVYVLAKTLADGKKIPRWQPRSQRTVNMGLSPFHASTVPLVFNPATGSITAQFHVVFDDWFTTIATKIEDLPDLNSPTWAELFGDSTYEYVFDEDDYSPDQSPPDSQDLHDVLRQDEVRSHFDIPATPLPDLPPSGSPFSPTPNPFLISQPSPQREESTSQRESSLSQRERPQEERPNPILAPNSSPTSTTTSPDLASPQGSTLGPSLGQSFTPSSTPLKSTTELKVTSPTTVTTPTNSNLDVEAPPKVATKSSKPKPPPAPSTPRRSTRNRRAPRRLGFDGSQGSGYQATTHQKPNSSIPVDCCAAKQQVSLPPATFFTDAFLSSGIAPPRALAARTTKDPDTLTWDEAIKDSSRSEWLKAAQTEIDALVKKGTWDEVKQEEATTKILPGTWVFRRKRTPDGRIKKFKARFCVRGDLQETEADTFAPVVAWSTVRLFLVLCLYLKWETVSIDFDNAFVQAKLDDPVWIHLPRGYTSTIGHQTCLLLKKSLYGLSVAPKLWHAHLLSAILSIGFKQSVFDPCLLYTSTMLLVIYVDDAGAGFASKSDLNRFLDQLRAKGFEFTQEGDFSEYLGIKLEKRPNGSIEMTQKGLIKKIIGSTGLENCHPNWNPASQLCLGSDPTGAYYDGSWSYASIVGMLLYLSTNTRPDISFAVSQVARFTSAPKQSHASAVKTIVRYLKRTHDKGLIVVPDGTLNLTCYVDADFAGLYRREPDESPNSVRSRTGYIILLGNCPLTWKSQLQSEIALSTLEAEYAALSMAMRTLLPLRAILLEAIQELQLTTDTASTVKCTVFEDNNGALSLATNQRITARTKHFLVKWHFFWSHVRTGKVQILKIDSAHQRADYLTKGLPRETFEKIREMVQHW